MKIVGILSVLLLLSLPSSIIAENNFSGQFQAGNTPSAIGLKFNLETIPMSAGITDNPNIGDILRQVNEDIPLITRGPQEAALYRKIAPSVVLIATSDGIGSGSLLNNNLIITNEHVVAGYQTVAVIFKPRQEGRDPQASDVVQGEVLLVDKTRDLAMVKVNTVPEHITPVRLGNISSISIGSDVHAIGHPHGISWTYTKGIVSQIHDMPLARGNVPIKVIQTQTPINPGNSGGPLLNDNGEIVGINSFKIDGEALNFAIAVDEIKRFVDGKSPTASKPSSTPQRTASRETDGGFYISYEGRNESNDADIIQYSLKGTNKIFFVISLPDDKRQPLILIMDRNLDGRPDAIIYSFKRNPEFWNESYWDNNFDGNYELKGLHRNGEMKPYTFVANRSGLPY